MPQENVVEQVGQLVHEIESTLDAAQEHCDVLRTTKVRDLDLGPHFAQLRSLTNKAKTLLSSANVEPSSPQNAPQTSTQPQLLPDAPQGSPAIPTAPVAPTPIAPAPVTKSLGS